MKYIFIIMLTSLATSCHSQNDRFIAERVQQSAKITLNGLVGKVFPLFGIMREKEWDHDWNPTPVYPTSGNIAEGAIYRTPGHAHGDPALIWVVSLLDTADNHLTYLVNAGNRVVSIDIRCHPLTGNRTEATIVYTMTGLNEKGNQVIYQHIANLFQHHLQNWESLINQALSR
jgi:hypothetical protein